MTAESFWATLYGRRSVRRYRDQPVPASLIEQVLEAAHQAPSGHNRQPWRFVVLRNPATRQQLAEQMAATWEAELLADGADPQEASRRAAISRTRITQAPVALLPCLDLTALDVYPDASRQQREWQMGVQSVALACQNLLLAAHHVGLAACWLCAPIFCPDLVRTVLDLPATLEPQALLTLGYPPADAPRSKPREPLASRLIER
ncbi:MAG: nitroreductase family protein [Anaerolineae bacterium]